MAYAAQANPTSQQPKYQQQQQAPQAAPQQQASPFKAPDMSSYAQPSGGYNAYNVPRTPPKGAQRNDLSGNVPANQIWGQAYNQVAQQFGIPGATSFTMPGSYSSQEFNPSNGQYGPMTGGQSFDGNMAYNAINNRPPPVSSSATGVGGNQMPWQDSLAQREAFVGNLSQRLGQYSSGQLTGPVTFDPSQLMQQANDQLANGSFYNPFSPQNQGGYFPSTSMEADFQRAMGNSTQYMQGSFQNPFGQQANVQQPSWNQQSYNPQQPVDDSGLLRGPQPVDDSGFIRGPNLGNDVVNVPPPPDYSKPYDATDDNAAAAAGWQKGFHGGAYNSKTGQYWDGSGAAPWTQQLPGTPRPSDTVDFSKKSAPQPMPTPSDTVDFSKTSGFARPIEPPSQGTPYNPQPGSQSLPPVPAAPAPAAPPSYGEDPIAARKKAAKQQEQDATGLQAMRDRWLSGATSGRSYREKLGGKNFKDHTPDQMADEYTGELWKRLNDGRLSRADYDKAVAGMDTDLNQSKAGQAKIQQIDGELRNWQRATYGTWQGNGPPASYQQHIRQLERLKERAVAGDPTALAWNPQGKAPPAHATPTVPLSGRGSAARFGGLRHNGG